MTMSHVDLSEPDLQHTSSKLRAQAWVRLAESHLREARRQLDAAPPNREAAVPHVMATVRASLRAFLAWDGSAPEDPNPAPTEAVDGADLHRLGGRAVRLSSVLKTTVHRALLFADRAPALSQGPDTSVTDREDVEAGWYAARDLFRTVTGELPAAILPSARLAVDHEAVKTESEIDDELDMSFPASDPPSWMP